MHNLNQNLKQRILNSFNKKLKSLLDDIVIKDKKVFVTLEANNNKDAEKLAVHKKECEEILKKTNLFDEIFVTFIEKENKFKNVIAVSSCKGGVGKSTVATNIALAYKRAGFTVGLLDADIYGPSVPKLLNINEKPDVNEKKKIIPVKKYGLETISIGFLIDDDKPVIWRGPMIQGALTQLIDEVQWSKLDYLVIDLPPGTGDAYLTILQKLKINKSLIVTTSQDLALSDTKKGINLMLKFDVPISGIIENMSYFKCDECSKVHYLFGKGKVEKLAKQFNTNVVAKLPISNDLVILPNTDFSVNKKINTVFDDIVKKLKD